MLLYDISNDLMTLDMHCREVTSEDIQEVRDHLSTVTDASTSLEAVLDTILEMLQHAQRMLTEQVAPVLVGFTIGYSSLSAALLLALCLLVAWPLCGAATTTSCLKVTSVCAAVTFTAMSLLLFILFFIFLVSFNCSAICMYVSLCVKWRLTVLM
jgi:hypothetical protein